MPVQVVDFAACRVQSEAYKAFKRNTRVCNAWARGLGKSHWLRQVMYLLIAEWDGRLRPGAVKKGVRIVLLMPTLVQFRRVHAKLLIAELTNEWAHLRAHIYGGSTPSRIDFPGGSWIQIVSAEIGNTASGIRCDVVMADEADDIDISFYEGIVSPWFSEPHSLNMRLITGTPRRGQHGLLWRAFHVWPNGDTSSPRIPGARAFHATYRDAPWVDMERVEAERRSTDPARFAREWECDFSAGEGLVYPQFNPLVHVHAPPDGGTHLERYIVGIDYGENDPTAIVVIGIAGKGRDAIFHVVHEVYGVHMSLESIASVARSFELGTAYAGAKWYADHLPYATKFLHDATGISITAADKGPGSVEDGVSLISNLLTVRKTMAGDPLPQLFVDPSCVHTIEEFGRYKRKRDPRDLERIVDVIDSDRDDHAMDALRMAIFSHVVGPERRLEKQQKLR